MKFEPGTYFFAGRDKYQGHDVIIIEHLPEFEDDDPDDDDYDRRISEAAEESFSIVMYIIPEDYQIVKIVLNNSGMDFLPTGGLVKVGEIKSWMLMDNPMGGKQWFPKHIYASAELATASGDFSFQYEKEFSDYSQTKVQVKYRFEPLPRKDEEEDEDEEK
jgi:hypothetical protein